MSDRVMRVQQIARARTAAAAASVTVVLLQLHEHGCGQRWISDTNAAAWQQFGRCGKCTHGARAVPASITRTTTRAAAATTCASRYRCGRRAAA